jgi:hypothetical protein
MSREYVELLYDEVRENLKIYLKDVSRDSE